MRRQLLPAFAMLAVFTVLTGVVYPLLVTAFGQGLFHDSANGSLVERDGEVVGSRWIGQPFTSPEYFHPRPQADGYVSGPSSSYGSNEGPTSDRFLYGEDDPSTPDVDEAAESGVDFLVDAYREENGLTAGTPVPVDAVTGSGSGLDPHISVANARIQAARVADERGLDLDVVLGLVEDNTDERALGFLGEPGVNVLELNLALDEAS